MVGLLKMVNNCFEKHPNEYTEITEMFVNQQGIITARVVS